MEKVKNALKNQYGKDLNKFVDNIPQIEIENIYRRNQENKIKKSSVCCFSLNYANKTMWTHYADSHNGICLIFNLLCEEPFVSHKPNRFTQGPVIYDKYEPINYLKSKRDGIVRLFLTKSKDWKYEEEYRFIIFENSGLFNFNNEFLKGIIFGLRVTDADIDRFKNICQKHGFNNLIYARFNKDRLDMRLEEK